MRHEGGSEHLQLPWEPRPSRAAWVEIAASGEMVEGMSVLGWVGNNQLLLYTFPF